MNVTARPAALLAVLSLVLLVTASCRDPQAAKARYVASAERYLAEGKTAEAVIEYRNAIDQDPKSSDLRQKLSETYLNAGDPANALQALVRAADLKPEDAELQIRTGQFLLLAKRFDDARARADSVLKKDERNVEAQILRANSLAGLEDLDGAVAEMEEAVSLNPERGNTYANLGILEMGRGKTDAADRAFKKAVELDPKSVAAHMALANFYWATGQANATEAALKGALRLDPENAAANRAMAAFTIATNRRDDAEPYLKKVHDRAKSPSSALALADYYIAKGDDAAAVALLEPMLAAPKTVASSSLRLAAIDQRRGRTHEAAARVDSVLAKDPFHLEGLLFKTTLLLTDGKVDEAHTAAQKAATKYKESAAAQFMVARTLAARKQTDEAIKAYEDVLRLNPRATQAKVALSHLHLARGQSESSVLLAQDAVRSEPENARAHVLLVQGLLTRRELSRAEAELTRLIARYPNSPMVLVQMGVLRGLQKNAAEARKYFDQAITLQPESVEPLAGHVALDIAAKNGTEARRRVDEGLARGDPSVPLLMLAAQTYSATGDVKGSEELLRRVLTKDPAHLAAYGALGQLYLRQGKLNEARAELEELAKRNPEPIGALTMIGTILQTQGNTSGAREYYERVLQIDPEAAVASNNLAWMHANSGGNLDVALNLAQTAKRRLPDSADVNDTLGFIYYKKDLPTMAIPLLKASVDKNPRNPSYHSHLGLAYAKAGEIENARQHLTSALKLKPDFEGAADAKRVLESLGSR
jgi:putative PEP-CTERM system TPR-repeat lipoprotein